MTLTYVFLVSTMLAIGMAVTGLEIEAVFRNRRLVILAFAGNLVLVPLLGLCVTSALRFDRDTAAAILLLAAAPGGLTAVQFTGKVKGGLALAAVMAFALTVVAIPLSPLAARVVLPHEKWASVPYARVGAIVALCVVLPLAVGFALRKPLGHMARKAIVALLVISNLSFVATIIATARLKKEAMRTLGPPVIAGLLILILGSMAIGWLLGGPERGSRRVMAIATSMRNAGLCLMVVEQSFPDTRMDAVVTAFMGLMVPPNMLFAVYHAIRDWRMAKKASAASAPDAA
jgi:bile acid:Na+ symporter, BASS family